MSSQYSQKHPANSEGGLGKYVWRNEGKSLLEKQKKNK